MTHTKAQIVDSIQSQLGLPKNQSASLVEKLLEIIKGSLESGDDIMISGFGKFIVKEKKARRGRNPATGDSLMLDKRRVVVFRCSNQLRNKIENTER